MSEWEGGGLRGSMHPRQIEQIPLYKSPSLSSAKEESSLSSVPPPLLHSALFLLLSGFCARPSEGYESHCAEHLRDL